MITTQLPDGTAVHHQHDQVGRLTYNKYTDGSWEAWEYDKAGRLTKAYNRDSVTEFVRNALGQVIKETQDGHSIMRKYDRAGHHVHTESSLGASIDYSHDKDGNLGEMNSGGWSARWQRDRVGLETERELTGGVHVKTHHDSLGRETYKSVGARNVEQFRRSYTWGIGNRLHATEDGLTGRRIRYDYDEFDNLLSAEYKQGNDVERIYRIPDRIGNLFETREKDDRKYGTGSRLAEDRDYFYHYDCEGNLVFKEFRTLDWTGVSVPLGGQKAHLEEELGITFRAFGAGWRYDWQSDGMLSRVVRPDGKEVSFAYDALGRRTEKTYEGVATHFVWDGNVPLHEWQEVSSDTEKTNITTWLFEQDTFIPAAKLAANGESFSIVSDYLGTPLQAFDNNGNKVWEQELDIFGRKRRKGNNNSSFIPFKYQGQYEDVETGLYYNRFRYYDSCIGNYISQDPIRLASNSVNLYSYISDSNSWLDIFGLFGSGKGTHTATINIYNSDGSLKPENPISIKSGDMTDAERSLGFPQSTLATHTEARAVKRYPLTDGERMEIIGQYPPCNSCRGKMRRATESGGIIDYKWINDKTGNQEWIRYEGNKKTIDSTSKNKKLHPKNIH